MYADTLVGEIRKMIQMVREIRQLGCVISKYRAFRLFESKLTQLQNFKVIPLLFVSFCLYSNFHDNSHHGPE